MTKRKHPFNPTAERREDELLLDGLHCYDNEGWSADDVAKALGKTRSWWIGRLRRIHEDLAVSEGLPKHAYRRRAEPTLQGAH
jgi:hypothetical protein